MTEAESFCIFASNSTTESFKNRISGYSSNCAFVMSLQVCLIHRVSMRTRWYGMDIFFISRLVNCSGGSLKFAFLDGVKIRSNGIHNG